MSETLILTSDQASAIARQLGQLGKGKRKTMSPAAIQQRQRAAKQRKAKAVPSMQNKYSRKQNTSGHVSASVV